MKRVISNAGSRASLSVMGVANGRKTPLFELKVERVFILRCAVYPAGLPPKYEEKKGCLSFTEKRPFCQFFPFILQRTK